MHVMVKYVGSAVVAASLAVLLTLYGFSMSFETAVQTGLIAAAVALAIVYMNKDLSRGQPNAARGKSD